MYFSRASFSRLNSSKLFRFFELSIGILLFRFRFVHKLVTKICFGSLRQYLKSRQSEVECIKTSTKNFFVYGKVGRQCLDVSSEYERKITLNQKNVYGISFNIAPLETLNFYLYRLWKFDIEVEVLVFDKDNQNLGSYVARYPISYKKHGIGRNLLGQAWMRYDLDFSSYSANPRHLVIRCKYVYGSLLALSDSSEVAKKHAFYRSPFLISEMDFLSYGKPKNKLVIVGESMTDPAWYMSDDMLVQKMPNYHLLRSMSVVYKNSVSAADSTLPHQGSFLSGKLPTEHLIGDYNAHPMDQALPSSLLTMPEAMKKQGYKTIGFTSYGRLGFNYSWPEMFDEYYNTDQPFDNDAPNASQLIRAIAANKNISALYYVHLTRLHLPFLSTDHNQAPCIIPMRGVSQALQNNNFRELLLRQFEAFDLELGQILSYLSTSNQLDDFEIFLTGDHGVKMPPAWKNQIAKTYDLYEEHIRVPLVYKEFHGSSARSVEFPVISQRFIYDCLVHKEHRYMTDEFFGPYAVSQTIYHPNRPNLGVAITTKDYKFWFFVASYFGNKSNDFGYDECLLFVKNEAEFDEFNDMCDELPDIKARFIELSKKILETHRYVTK